MQNRFRPTQKPRCLAAQGFRVIEGGKMNDVPRRGGLRPIGEAVFRVVGAIRRE